MIISAFFSTTHSLHKWPHVASRWPQGYYWSHAPGQNRCADTMAFKAKRCVGYNAFEKTHKLKHHIRQDFCRTLYVGMVFGIIWRAKAHSATNEAPGASPPGGRGGQDPRTRPPPPRKPRGWPPQKFGYLTISFLETYTSFALFNIFKIKWP